MKWLILALLTLTGCATMPGGVTQYESKAEGIKHLYMEPGWVGAGIKLGLHRTTEMPKDEVYFVVLTKLKAAQVKDGLIVNIDGEKTTFSAVDQISDIAEHGFLEKRFKVSSEFIKKMVAGKSVWVRVNHIGNSYYEGEFSKSGYTTAKDGFVKYLTELEKFASN